MSTAKAVQIPPVTLDKSIDLTRSTVLLCILILSYEIYSIIYIPNVFYWKLALKIGLLYLCAIYSIFKINVTIISKHLFDISIIFLYMLFVFLSSINAVSRFYCLAQGAILLALLFFLFYVTCSTVGSGRYSFPNILVLIFTSAICLSLIAYLINPSLFATIEAGARRVHGIYGEPAKLGAICGINIGVAYFAIRNKTIKYLIIIISFVCLILTGFRTALIAVILTEVSLIFLSNKVKAVSKIAVSLILVIFVGGVFVLQQNILESGNRYLRSESIKNMSGRTSLWTKAIPIALSNPFGSGFCLGGTVLTEKNEEHNFLKRRGAAFTMFAHSAYYKATLHNGYIQALCDFGLVGFLFYVFIFLRGAWFVIRNRFNEKMLIFIFFFLFMSFSNLTESIVMSPTSTNSILFWFSWFMLMINSGNIS